MNESKTEGHIQVWGTLTRLGSMPMFWHPKEQACLINWMQMFVTEGTKSCAWEQAAPKVKGSLPIFFLETLSSSQGIFHNVLFFWPCSDKSLEITSLPGTTINNSEAVLFSSEDNHRYTALSLPSQLSNSCSPIHYNICGSIGCYKNVHFHLNLFC